MEPRPKGFDPSGDFAWLNAARSEYSPVTGDQYTETSFLRGNASIEILEEIIPELPRKPNILLIGLGLDAEPLQCCYAPFKIAAWLEGKRIDYSMTLVDADEEVIKDVTSREKLYLTRNHAERFNDTWIKYLKSTRQKQNFVTELESDLTFSEYLMNGSAFGNYKDYLERGIVSANIPENFRRKRTSGGVKILHNDIATANIQFSGPFNYVEFTNVLYLMSQSGQKLAIANVAKSMATHARLLVNDIGGYTGTPLFPRFNGWLNDEIIEQLGLTIEAVISEKDTSRTVLFKKEI